MATDANYESTLALIPKISQWYWVIPIGNSFLEHVLKNVKKTEDALAFVSSRLRMLPLPSNYADHRLYIRNAKGEFVQHFGDRFHSSHIATRDGLDFPIAVQKRHAESNLAKVMEKAKPGKPLLMQTLISPIDAARYIPSVVTDYMPHLPPDLDLDRLAQAAVASSKSFKMIWLHNHPMNFAKRIYYTAADDKRSLALLESAEEYVSTTPGLQGLLDDYKDALESPLGTATFWDYDGRELFS